MKQLDLQKSIETFAVFDILMILLALFGALLGLAGFLLGGVWFYLTYFMILGELMLAYGILVAPRRLKTVVYREAIGQSSNVWLKIAFISDLHLHKKKGKAWVEKITKKLQESKPDILLVGGDMVVHDAKDIDYGEPLKNAETTYGSYYILGNHDYQDDPAQLTAKLSALGFHNLTNSGISINVQGKELRIFGLDDGFYGLPKLSINRGDDKAAHITLVHESDLIHDIKEEDTDLVLCGHAHGGQVGLPLVGALHVPSAFGCKADGGRKIIKGIPTIISRGLGEVGVRARLFTPPEIVIIELGI
ncbi:MAG: metallophosphoesterase [Patescibacteria group bacterium]|nr:metallophosphoesterase [Patescibacteria group bacterium]